MKAAMVEDGKRKSMNRDMELLVEVVKTMAMAEVTAGAPHLWRRRRFPSIC